MSIDCSLKSLTSPGSSELLQSHNSLTFKLLKTVADFSQALATLHDNFGHELQMLVETFRKRNGELRKERSHNSANSLFQVWELFLQQVEVNSQQHGDISRNLSQNIGNGLIERVFHRKIQSKKIFAHRERIETILLKSNELLHKCYGDYCQAYALALSNPAQYMSEYIGSHNVYVHQLQATNGMIHAYQTKTLPKLLEELEECHLDTSLSISSALLASSELVAEKSSEQTSGYQLIGAACRQTNHRADLAQFVRLANQRMNSSQLTNESSSSPKSAPASNHQALEEADDSQIADKSASIRYHQFQAPNWQNALVESQNLPKFEAKNLQIVPTFKNEIAPDLSQPPAQQQPQLETDRADLEEKIEKFEERIESLSKLLVRSNESRLHNKVNELQEELCQRRFDLHVAQIHLSAVRSQLQLFEYNYRPASSAHLIGELGVPVGELQQVSALNALSRKTSSNSAFNQPIGYRNKWIKAFKSLKETPSSIANSSQQKFTDDLLKSDLPSQQQQQQQQQQPQQNHQQQNQPENQHFFQEYTFKKIASCDVCKDFLRGHMRQGVKCKLCKISCHNDCQSKAHALLKCQQPKIKLLRRQKSAGELEVNNSDADSADPSERTMSSKPDSIYQLIRQVLDAKKKSSGQQAANQLEAQTNDYHLLRPYAPSLANSALMNLSTGNLALANQDGKSVSTSALGSSTAASVDRWAVVMDLLAESRKKDKENAGDSPEVGVSTSGKRHSKQLDKFKLAAKSAAAASKHKHHYLKQQQRPQATPTQNPHPQDSGEQYAQQQLASVSSAPLARQYNQLLNADLNYLSSDQHSSALHLHHTKSLPVGKLTAPNSAQLEMQMPAIQQQQQQPTANYQLFAQLGSQQQLQSTSAPHSPQRKRFNLRMKSFSLDSPESPSVQATPLNPNQAGNPVYPPSEQLHHEQQQHQYEIYHHYQSRSGPYQYQFANYQQYPTEADSQALTVYLSASQTRVGVSSGGQYQHRHSYQNPSTFHYSDNTSEPINSAGPPIRADKLSGRGGGGSSEALSGESQRDYYDLNRADNLVASSQQILQQTASQQQQQQSSNSVPSYVVLYDYIAQRGDEIQLSAGQVVAMIDSSEQDWWRVRALDGSNCAGFFPSSYLAKLYQNERPLQVVQTIQVSNGETCDKLLRGQIVIHTGKQMDNFVTIRVITGPESNNNHYIQCPEEYLMEVVEAS